MSLCSGSMYIWSVVLCLAAAVASANYYDGGGEKINIDGAVKSRKKIRSHVEHHGILDSTTVDTQASNREEARPLSYAIDKEGDGVFLEVAADTTSIHQGETAPRHKVQGSNVATNDAALQLLRMLASWEDGPKTWSYDVLEKATKSRDAYGALAAFPQLTEMTELDTNKDGVLNEAEVMQFRGLSHRLCRNTGERQYGCTARCAGGDNNLDGKFHYFEGKKIVHSKFSPDVLASFKMAAGGGAVSNAQKKVLGMSVEEVVNKNVEGAICEFGVFTGGTSVFLHRTIEKLGASKTHPLHLFDSFEGLPDCDMNKDTGACGGKQNHIMAVRMELVKQSFTNASLPTPPMHKGFFDKIPDEEFPDKIAFAFIDGDLYPSIYTALQRIYPRLSKGGIVAVHDYAFELYPGTEAAIDDFLKDKPEKAMLPASSEGVACYLGMIRKQ